MSIDGRFSVDLTTVAGAAFDLDGVITQTASVHSAAWKKLFDAFLAKRAGETFQPFDVTSDYIQYVDGKPRDDGVRDFLRSRGITLPDGSPDDPPELETVRGLGRRKNALFREALAQQGVRVFDGSVEFLRRLRQAGIKTAMVSSSENAVSILAAAGLDDLFDVCVDGIEAARLGLEGKPSPDTFLHAARILGVSPARMLGVEDSIAGVKAIRAAGFAVVIGIDHTGHAATLLAGGAGIVVSDLRDLEVRDLAVSGTPAHFPPPAIPLAPESDPEWMVLEEGFTPAREHEIEALFAIGNGGIGSRGSLAEGSSLSAPATFIAGAFDAGPSGSKGLATAPDWTSLSISVDGQPLDLQSGLNLEHWRVLDLRQAAVFRGWRHQDAAGRITCIRGFRVASSGDRRILMQSIALSPENYSGTISFDTAFVPVTTWVTTTGITLSLAGETQLTEIGSSSPAGKTGVIHSLSAHVGMAYRVDRIVAVHTSRDSDNPEASARTHLEQAVESGLSKLLDDHLRAWKENWDACDVRLDGDSAVQRALRFAIYHLLSAANPDDSRASIGARGLTGFAYQGHVFWDTEIFMLPFFILTRPAIARALLDYRHYTLPAARRRAEHHASRGALYAWESADTGDDVTPPFVVQPGGEVTSVLTGAQEIHISADVAFAAWNYWNATGDTEFLLKSGAEILLETARFWESRAKPGDDGQFHINRVIGPDEYHETVDDDAYTNAMAKWNLNAAAGAADLVRKRWPRRWEQLSAQLEINDGEQDRWRDVARRMYTGLKDTGLIEQFRGYFDLEEIDLAQFRRSNAPMEVLLGRDRLQRSQVIKQPDVVMLLHLLRDEYPPAIVERNFRYYEPRCAHGSSLSPAIHALIAARLGDMVLASRYLQQAMEIDLADNMGNAASGVHLGALGGLWQAVIFGFGGLRVTSEGPVLEPHLPDHWREMTFPILWQGLRHNLRASAKAGTRPEEDRQ